MKLISGGGGTSIPALTDNGTNVISTEAFLAPNGTAGLPAYGFSATAGIGMYRAGALQLGLAVNSNPALTLSVSNGIQADLPTTATTTYFSINGDTYLSRKAAGNWRLGRDDVNGVPVSQILSVQSAVTGSNLAAANFTLDAGLGTGTGLVGTFTVRGADSSVATGTTVQTPIVRCVLNATKALATGAATTLVSIPLASLQMTGGYISVYMEATDGTSQATRCEEVYYAAENSAGVFVTSTGVVGTGVTAATATKTLTATYALTSANPALLQVTPTLTGITATRFTCIYEVHHMGNTQPTV